MSELRDTLRLQSNQQTKQTPHRHNKHQTKKVKQNSTQQTKEREVTLTKQKQTKRQVCEKHRSTFSFNTKRRKQNKREQKTLNIVTGANNGELRETNEIRRRHTYISSNTSTRSISRHQCGGNPSSEGECPLLSQHHDDILDDGVDMKILGSCLDEGKKEWLTVSDRYKSGDVMIKQPLDSLPPSHRLQNENVPWRLCVWPGAFPNYVTVENTSASSERSIRKGHWDLARVRKWQWVR